jgi:transcriptional regulator with XRE-family HTH domain
LNPVCWKYISSKLEIMDVTDRLARRLHSLRAAQGLSLDALAARSGVSRSNISLIERGQSSPTATVLDKLSVALGVTLAALFEDSTAAASAPSPLARRADQLLWTDPGSSYQRRNLSPSAPAPIQLVEVLFPPGQQVAYETGPRLAPVHQQVWVIEGSMQLTVGPGTWLLQAGDCLAMQLDQPTLFRNPGAQPARYLVALASMPLPALAQRTP